MTEAKTIEDMVVVAEAIQTLKSDSLVLPASVEFSPDECYLTYPGFGPARVALNMDDWAMTQVCAKLGPPPLKYMRVCPPNLRATNLNHWAKAQTGKKTWLIREFDNAGEDGIRTCRAVLSDRYQDIPNVDILKTCAGLLQEQEYRIVRPYLTHNDLQLRIAPKNLTFKRDDGNYGGGVHIANGEVGNRRFVVAPYVLRTSCWNSFTILEKAFMMRHVKSMQFNYSMAFINAMLSEHIGRALQVSAEAIERVTLAYSQDIPGIASVIEKICQERGLSEEIQQHALIGTEKSETRMGLINGFSFAAQKLEDLEEDRRVECEAISGALLWNIDGDPVRVATRTGSITETP
jgi:hypothetical protein